ncbi:MAG: UTP--glucose-1-phosphate uridylyltransferase GalU [Hyphomicrobiaceae bacterium]|nr:UTP--glucose-1-phosphate uridylyltransferase GalU [Hyphomicrobiaceae bacterium]
MTHKPIRKAIFPVAGLGTRFLPATKAMPKEMLTIVDRPIIQRVVDEAREAGIEHFIFVTGRNKGVIEDHFDRQAELEMILEKKGKHDVIKQLNDLLPGPGQTSFTRQQEPLGLGHAVWCARELVGNEPFALLLPDMLTQSPGDSCLKQMINNYNEKGGNIIGVEEVADSETDQYGIVSIKKGAENCWPITGMVEKPPLGTAPSNLMIMGRYILQPEIFSILKDQRKGAGNEIQLTDAMHSLMEMQDFHAVKHNGMSFDCGSRVGFLTANVAFALASPDLRNDFAKELRNLLDNLTSQAAE